MSQQKNISLPLHNQKRAIIIGASSGIGAALVRILAQENYLVAALARREKQLTAVCQGIPAATPYVHDVTDYDTIPEPDALDPTAELLEQINNADPESAPCINFGEWMEEWLANRDNSCTCGTYLHWDGIVSGSCRGRWIGVRDEEFEAKRRYAITDRGDWCSRWAAKDGSPRP